MKNSDSFFVSPDSTIFDVLRRIDDSGQKIAFVIDSQKFSWVLSQMEILEDLF